MRLTVQYHVENPRLSRIPELTIKPMPECEGGGWYIPVAEAVCLANAVNSHSDLLAFAHAHDAYMSKHYSEGPDSSALHPDAAANWKRCRTALAQATETSHEQ